MRLVAAPDGEGIALTEGSAADFLTESIAAAYARLQAATPEEIAINLAATFVVLLAVFVLDRLARWLAIDLGRKQANRPPGAGAGEDEEGELAAPITLQVVRATLGLGGLYLVLRAWGLEPFGWIQAGFGAAFAGWALRLLVSVLLLIALWEIVSGLIDRGLRRQARRAADPRRAAQLRSLAPLARGAARTVMLVIGVMLLISQIGIEVAPLLAGAGVLSIAVGFGAQTLVKDYLTGFSLVLEDIAAVGDVVRIGESSGLVEAMTLRTIRLRDFDGTLHVIPYSEAQIVHNLTKTFSYYVLDLSISYGSDIDRALTIIREVGDSMKADPAFGPLMLGPIEVYGVDKLADSGVMLKARLKTLPAKQWDVGREFNRRIKIAFDEGGVEIPFPHMKLVVETPQA